MLTRVALLTGAHPVRCEIGPIVRLIKGTWKIIISGIDDSTLTYISTHNDGALRHGMKLEGPTTVQISFGNRGNERHITVLAEKVA